MASPQLLLEVLMLPIRLCHAIAKSGFATLSPGNGTCLKFLRALYMRVTSAGWFGTNLRT